MRFEFGRATPSEAAISAAVFLAFGAPTAILVDNFYVGFGVGLIGLLLVNNWYWMARTANNRVAD